MTKRKPPTSAATRARLNDGWCIDCGDEFHFDDTGGWCIYNPPCVCGMHCRHCHELAEREDDADDYPDDEELTHG